MDRSDPRPEPIFTRDELRFLQDLLDNQREGWFNYMMETLSDPALSASEDDARAKYHLAKTLRDKVYHLGGRDTLALGPATHEQRHWDQQHDY